jgi:lipoyl(octanoyl) transferase
MAAELPAKAAVATDAMAGLVLRSLGLAPYEPIWQAMVEFTRARGPGTADEIWLLEHPPVFTLGLAGRPEHLLRDIGVPVLKVDRGGQITYHGPGQVVAYLLLDLARKGLKVRELVWRIEQTVIDLLAGYGIAGERRAGAPGVFVGEAKIAAQGLRVRRGCCYHGLSLNVRMDLSPFEAIDPCGYSGLRVTQLADLGVADEIETIGAKLAGELARMLSGKV